MHVVIVGNGVAGIEAAITVRNREPKWNITIVSEESDHFFSRTALMWVICGQLSHQCIEPHERDLYERMGFVRVRARAVGLDVEAHELHVSGQAEPLRYDRLLIACGSAPRKGPWPGSDLGGVGHLVTMQDLEWLEAELHGGPGPRGRPPRPDHHRDASDESSPYWPRARTSHAGAPSHPAVIGGGLIGIEAVEVMAARGLRPRFLIREEWFWPIAVDRAESTWIADRMGEHGVDVCLEENVEALEGEGELAAIQTDKARYECDLCVIAIGVVPGTQWLQGGEGPYREAADLELDRGGGIVVDAGLATSAPDVFAAGDCASVRWYNGWQRPEQLWYTARDQGRVVGRRLVGDAADYRRGLWYNSAKLMDIEYTTAGLVNMNVEGEQNWFYEERGKVRSTSRVVVADGAVVGFNFLGRRWDHSVLLRWIEERRTLDYALSHLGEASFDTEFVPPLVVPPTRELTGPAASGLTAPSPNPVRAGS